MADERKGLDGTDNITPAFQRMAPADAAEAMAGLLVPAAPDEPGMSAEDKQRFIDDAARKIANLYGVAPKSPSGP